MTAATTTKPSTTTRPLRLTKGQRARIKAIRGNWFYQKSSNEITCRHTDPEWRDTQAERRTIERAHARRRVPIGKLITALDNLECVISQSHRRIRIDGLRNGVRIVTSKPWFADFAKDNEDIAAALIEPDGDFTEVELAAIKMALDFASIWNQRRTAKANQPKAGSRTFVAQASEGGRRLQVVPAA